MGQDCYIDNFFNKKRNGVFIDIGAHNGKEISNTYFLKKYRNWTGICIEPNSTVYSELIKNRNCICLNSCVYNTNTTVVFRKISGYSEMLSGIETTYEEKHLNRIERETQMIGNRIEFVNVETFTLTYICNENNIRIIDYISIDTEGSELQILEGIDFINLDINIINIEINYLETGLLIHNFLLNKNFYLLIKIGGDSIYQNNKYK